MNKETKEWLASRPIVIRKLFKKYPPGEYIMKAGAPYSISCPGTKVDLYSYHENGNVSVIVMAENKTKKGIFNEKILSLIHGKDEKKIHLANVQVEINPKWMTLIKVT